jgi:hypothetical protein
MRAEELGELLASVSLHSSSSASSWSQTLAAIPFRPSLEAKDWRNWKLLLKLHTKGSSNNMMTVASSSVATGSGYQRSAQIRMPAKIAKNAQKGAAAAKNEEVVNVDMLDV